MDHFRANRYHTLGTGKLTHHLVRNQWKDFGHRADYGPFAFDGTTASAHPDVPAPFREIGEIDGSFGPLIPLTDRTSAEGKPLQWQTGDWSSKRILRVDSEEDRDRTGDELNTEWAVENLQKLAAENNGKPFFMGVGFVRPHTPLIVPQKFFDLFPLDSIELPKIRPGDVEDTFARTVRGLEGGQEPDASRSEDMGTRLFANLVASYPSQDEALRRFIQAYLACVAAVDDEIGKILDALDATGFADNTVVVLTSDHGWGMGEKDYLYKNSLWQESTRVPLIIRAPGLAKAGGKAAHPVSLIDVYPTLIDVCGLSADTMKNGKGHALDGHSLKPFLTDPTTTDWTGPDAALTALYKWRTKYDPAEESYSLRFKDWRYIRYENGKEELYHTTEDPHEWTNLAEDPAFADQLKTFRTKLAARVPESGTPPPPQPPFKPKGSTQSAAKPELSDEEWKDTYFKKHPGADANQDGTLTWPEYKAHKSKLDAGEIKKPAPAKRLQTSGTFSKGDEGIIFTDSNGGQLFYVIDTLNEMTSPHLDKPVKVVAMVKPTATGKAQIMVHIVQIKPAK